MFLKTNKRITALLIIVLIILNMLMPIISKAVDDTTSIEVVNAEGKEQEIFVGEGEEFTVNINLANPVDGALALAGILNFDPNKLEIVNKVDIGDGSYVVTGYQNLGSINMVEWNEIENSDSITFAFKADYGKLKDGLAFPVTFKVKDGVSGNTNIGFQKVIYSDAAADETTYSISVGNDLTVKIKTPLESISLNKTETTIGIGSSEKLTVTYNPADTTDSKVITWKSNNTSVATVDSEGNVTGIAPGEAEITATCGNKTATCTVNVTSKLQSISLNKSVVELAKEQTEQLTVVYNPTNTTDDKTVSWESSDTDVATVDQNGLVTAKANGTTKITVKSVVPGIEDATCTINVTSKLQSISLSETSFEMIKGNEKTLTVTYNPGDTTDDKTIIWTSTDESIATVENGKITAIKPGIATIIANCGGKIAEATVTVISPLTSIDIGNDFEILPGQEKQLTVTYNPADTTDSKTIIWESSKTDVATVDSNGKILAIAPGTTTITAKCGNITDTIDVTVNPVPMEGIAINKAETTIEKNKTENLNIIFYPENTTDNRDVIWTSDNELVATVENGVVTAVGAGTTKIEAKVGNFTATCTVNVIVPLTGITLNETNVNLEKGNTKTLSVNYLPNDTTDSKNVTWTSKNPSVATVKNGVVTAVGAGTAIIEAKVGNFTATCTVNVIVPLTGISIKDSINLIKDQSETLVVTYLPSDTTDDRTVEWASKDTSIATVDKNGKVTGLKEGTTTITAKVGDFEEECMVTVKEIKLTGIAIDNKIDSLLKGQNIQLGIIYTPENTTDSKLVEWTSSDESILTVDKEGNVVAIKAGKATITATSGEFTDSFELEVKEISLTGIEIQVDDTEIEEGKTLKLNIKFVPENTTDSKKLVYTSSDEAILTVDENGMVTAKKAGKATVTVVAENGVKTQIELTVKQAEKTDIDDDKQEEIVESPQTGDINIALYIGLMLISVVGIIKSIRRKK